MPPIVTLKKRKIKRFFAKVTANAQNSSTTCLVRSVNSQSTICEIPRSIYERYSQLMPNSTTVKYGNITTNLKESGQKDNAEL